MHVVVADLNKYKFFKEYFDFLFCFIKSKLYVVDYQDPELYNKLLNAKCVFSVQTLLVDPTRIKSVLYVVNFEQNSRKSEYYNHIVELLKNNIKVIDYSNANINIINNDTNGIYKHLLYHLPVVFKFNFNVKTRDVCFMGGISEYRSKYMPDNVDIIENFGKPRDEELKKYKIIVNIAYNESYKILEALRCHYCLSFGIIVISDIKLLENNPAENMIIFTEPENIKSKVKYVLDNYEKVHAEIFSEKNKQLVETWINKTLLTWQTI